MVTYYFSGSLHIFKVGYRDKGELVTKRTAYPTRFMSDWCSSGMLEHQPLDDEHT